MKVQRQGIGRGLRALCAHECADAFASFDEPQVRQLWDL